MIEELQEYLIRKGWEPGVAADIHDAYCESLTEGGGRSRVRLAVRWADSEQHDYSGEVVNYVRRWQHEVGERVWPYEPGDEVIVGVDTPEVLRAACERAYEEAAPQTDWWYAFVAGPLAILMIWAALVVLLYGLRAVLGI